MNDFSYKLWSSYSDKALAQQIGAFVRHQRLQQNKSQEQLCREAGISRSTLSLLERGDSVTLSTLLQVLRILDKLDFMKAFSTEQPISPMLLLKEEKMRIQRASKKRKPNSKQTDW